MTYYYGIVSGMTLSLGVICFYPRTQARSVIGRVKRAPHWAVQSRFCMIYIHNYVGIYVYRMPKCVGGSRFWKFEMKCSYNFRLEFLVLPLSGRLQPTRDTRINSFLLYPRAALAWTKNNNKRSLRNEKLKANRASETEEQRKERHQSYDEGQIDSGRKSSGWSPAFNLYLYT